MFKFIVMFTAALGATVVFAQQNLPEAPNATSNSTLNSTFNSSVAIDYDALARQRTYLGGLDEEDLKVQEPLSTPLPPIPFDTGEGNSGADGAATGGEEEPSEDPGL